jgi:hypothetical protein
MNYNEWNISRQHDEGGPGYGLAVFLLDQPEDVAADTIILKV